MNDQVAKERMMEQHGIPSKRTVDRALMALLGRQELIDTWWSSPNYFFSLQHPIDIWNKDDDGKLSVAHYVISFLQR